MINLFPILHDHFYVEEKGQNLLNERSLWIHI